MDFLAFEPLPYVVCLGDADGSVHHLYSCESSWRAYEIRDDGWAYSGGERVKRWVVGTNRPWGSAVRDIVYPEKLDNIRKIEALRWRAIEHHRGVLSRKLREASTKVAGFGSDARYVRDGRVYEIVVEDRGGGRTEVFDRPVEPSKSSSIVDQLAELPTPTAPSWIAAAEWNHAHAGSMSGVLRIQRISAILRFALARYLRKHYPHIVDYQREPRRVVRFTINGRHYAVAPGLTDSGNGVPSHWPEPTDINIDLDKGYLSVDEW